MMRGSYIDFKTWAIERHWLELSIFTVDKHTYHNWITPVGSLVKVEVDLEDLLVGLKGVS